MHGCLDLSKLPKTSRISSVRFRKQTPGSLPLPVHRPLLPSQRLDPHHPIDNDQRRKVILKLTAPGFEFGAIPMGLLAQPGVTPRRNGTQDVRHRAFIDLPFDPWFNRVARARAAGGNKSIEPMLPVNPQPGTVTMSLQLRPMAKFTKHHRHQVVRRFKSAISLIVVRGAHAEVDNGRLTLVYDPDHSPDQWLLPGWTYFLHWSMALYRMPYPELIKHLRPMLSQIFQHGSKVERRWADITSSMRIPVPVSTKVVRPHSEQAPDPDFNPFSTLPSVFQTGDGVESRSRQLAHADTDSEIPSSKSQYRQSAAREEHDNARPLHWTKPGRKTMFGLREEDSEPPKQQSRTFNDGPENGTETLRDAIFSAVNMRFSRSSTSSVDSTTQDSIFDLLRKHETANFDNNIEGESSEALQDLSFEEISQRFDAASGVLDNGLDPKTLETEFNVDEHDALGFVISQEMKAAWDSAGEGGNEDHNEKPDKLSFELQSGGGIAPQRRRPTKRTPNSWIVNRKPLTQRPTNSGFPVTSTEEEEAIAKRLAAVGENNSIFRPHPKAKSGSWGLKKLPENAGITKAPHLTADKKLPAAPPTPQKTIESQEDRLRKMLFRAGKG
ncbi:hypothetical protein MIND_00361100 [Mycena indigotica]|uniref:Uncharacterized protein n=1 Tax=Mycena indigotica TaxID=2126181 RepID=A0A8H6WCM3_9AGAR|nr:uncharacterized protein MIND_00361100 [Mycena indigotica]KAF7309888.1 hypothetical protein MIND_00361100 [Mycena indigotica]